MRAHALIRGLSAGALSALVACGTLGAGDDDRARERGDGDAGLACAGETKRCDGRCVPTTDPATGCADPTCTPCAVPNGEASCADGACTLQACGLGWGDCDGDPVNGCETSLRTSPEHCGRCGRRCEAGSVCSGGTCERGQVAATRAWLGAHVSGFCAAAYNQVLNLCGDVTFCFDPRVLRSYPKGLGVDVGFFVGKAERGQILSIGGECREERIQVFLVNGSLHVLGQGPLSAQVAVTPGKHLLSLQWGPLGGGMFLDGTLVAHLGAPTNGVKLLPACGPGIVLGNRHAYWWEHDREPEHASAAYFFFHVRDLSGDPLAWDLTTATEPGPSTVELYDERGALASTWTPTVGDVVGIGKNSKNAEQDPRIGLPPDEPPPIWKPLAECAVR